MFNIKSSKVKQYKTKPKYKYTFNSQIYDLAVDTNASFDKKLGVSRLQQNQFNSLDKIKSNPSFLTEKKSDLSDSESHSKISIRTPNKITTPKNDKARDKLRLPQIRKSLGYDNPEDKVQLRKEPENYYQSIVYKALKTKENTYTLNLARQHFIQNVEAIRIGKNMKLTAPKQIKMPKKNPRFKTIFLDLDETLIHCDQSSSNYTIKLNFPIEGGGTISAGIRVRPFCHEFIKELSSFAEIIIFTASASSYADIVLDYLDPEKKFFSHRLYRQHCTIEKGFYTKDLRTINRRPEDVAIVDNSAFSYMAQPEFGIPILPFYHFAKDRQLLSLLQYLKKLVLQGDMRQLIRKTFFWQVFRKNEADPRALLRMQFQGNL